MSLTEFVLDVAKIIKKHFLPAQFSACLKTQNHHPHAFYKMQTLYLESSLKNIFDKHIKFGAIAEKNTLCKFVKGSSQN